MLLLKIGHKGPSARDGMHEQQIVQTEENRQPAKDQNELNPSSAAMDLHAVHLDQLTRALPQQGRDCIVCGHLQCEQWRKRTQWQRLPGEPA